MSKPRKKTTKPGQTPQTVGLPRLIQVVLTLMQHPRVALLQYGFLALFAFLVLVRPIAASLEGRYRPGREIDGALIAIGAYIAVGLLLAALERAGRSVR